MKILSVKISNILSIEEALVEFDDSGLMLVQGWNHDVGRANGAGKTAIFNAIAFAIYDKLPRKITATEILRRGSKSGYAEVRIASGGEHYTVRRSRPKGVTFYKGDEVLGVTQEGFEQIIRLNYSQFAISMYAAQGTSTRFLSINDSDKKQFLLQLLNLEEFSSCKLLADRKIKSLEGEITVLNSKVDSIDAKIDAYQESICDENVIRHHIALGNQHIADLTRDMSSVQLVQKPDLSRYQQVEEDIAQKKTEFTRVKTRREMLHEQHRKLSAKAATPFQGSDRCRACGTSLDLSSAKAAHEQEIAEYVRDLAGIKSEIDQCDTALLKEKSINDLSIKLRDKKREESRDYETAYTVSVDLQSKISLKQQELKELNLKLSCNSELHNKIKGLINIRDQIVINRGALTKDVELFGTISAMYSPTGAQAYILDSVIESFNEKVVDYISLLWDNLTYDLKSYKETVKGDVTAKFSENLVMDGKSISIGSLSGGEFRALSLCVDFALVDVMERQFGISISPIILDEPYDGLDASGKALITELLEALADRRQIVIVDHSSEINSMFSKVIKVEKRNGVSTVSLES
jgi:DNA repair exonuclease SbcCD ATPase subunit